MICGAAIQTATFLIASLGQKLDFRHRQSSSSREVVCTSGCKIELQGPIFSSVLWQMKVWSSSEVCEHSCHNVVLIYLLLWWCIHSWKWKMWKWYENVVHSFLSRLLQQTEGGYEDNLFRYHAIYRNEWMTQTVLTGQQQDNCRNAVQTECLFVHEELQWID